MAKKPPATWFLDRWHEGDDEALGEILRQHLDWLHRKVHEKMTPALRVHAETGDIVQDCLLEFLKNAPRFHIENSKLFRGLMLTIAMRTMQQEYRWWAAQRRNMARERPLPEGTLLELQGGGGTPSLVAAESEQLGFIRLGMEFLEPDEQKVIVLADYDKLSWAEIGDQLGGLAPDAARMRYKRATAALAGIVGKLRRGRLAELVEAAD